MNLVVATKQTSNLFSRQATGLHIERNVKTERTATILALGAVKYQ